MKALLDSHAFLWFILDDRRLSTAAGDCISDPGNDILVSPATLWEIAIKIRLGKYALPEPYEPFIDSQLAGNDFSLKDSPVNGTSATMSTGISEPMSRR